MIDEYVLTIHPFEMGAEKDAANKVLEEASEAREAAQNLRYCLSRGTVCPDCEDDAGLGACASKSELADELADVIQAACNLAARYNIDMGAAMERCEDRNRARGRLNASNSMPLPEMSEGAKRVFDRLMEGVWQ